MKSLNILSLLVIALASKASADCFSTQLGYPCCENTNEVVAVDENGVWGIENGVWCGIGHSIKNDDYESSLNNTDWKLLEQQQQQQQQQNIIQKRQYQGDYMSKLRVVNTCPMEARFKQNGINYPTAQKITYFSRTTNKNRQMNIILPVGYNPNKRYPVLYFLHGMLQYEDSMLEENIGTIAIPTYLAKQGKAKEMIIVLPNVYAPPPGKEAPAEFNEAHFLGYNNFINEIVNDIMPYMQSHYSVATGRENTAICGFSMGGRTSIYIGFQRPDLFGYVGAFSPAPGLIPADDSNGHHNGLYTVNNFRSNSPAPIVTLISCGTNDSAVHQFPKEYHEVLTRNNQRHIWFEIPGADHDARAISAGLYNFVSAAFGALN
nr:feruloyl esterase [Pecoramyces sp. F1]